MVLIEKYLVFVEWKRVFAINRNKIETKTRKTTLSAETWCIKKTKTKIEVFDKI